MFLPLPHVQGLLHLHEFNKQQNPFHNLYIQCFIIKKNDVKINTIRLKIK
jgi:hypothetical protein